MPLSFEHGIELPQPPAHVFAVLDDVAQTPHWLARCTGIVKLSPGPNGPGTRLRYSYREGGRTGVMDGEITVRVPNERLTFHYEDTMMEVTVDFRVAAAGTGTRLVHAIEISPRTLMARIFSPLIRKQLPTQTVTAMETLRSFLAAQSI